MYILVKMDKKFAHNLQNDKYIFNQTVFYVRSNGQIYSIPCIFFLWIVFVLHLIPVAPFAHMD